MPNSLTAKISLLALIVISLSCDAKKPSDQQNALSLLETYLSKHYSKDQTTHPEIVKGDFNADGLPDTAVLFQPNQTLKQSSKIKTYTPWIYPNSLKPSNEPRRSLAIFHGTADKKPSTIINPVHCLLDYSGVLETPSFKLLASHQADKTHALHTESFEIPPKGDLIIIPTEAGIDTYVYWNGSGYSLFEPEEMP